MTVLIGALVGAGIWLVGRGLLRRPVPLLRALREYREPVPGGGATAGGGPAGWRNRAERRALQVVESFGLDLGTLGADLRIVGRSPASTPSPSWRERRRRRGRWRLRDSAPAWWAWRRRYG